MLAFAESLARRATWLPGAEQRDEYLSAVPKVLALATHLGHVGHSLHDLEPPVA